VQQNIVLDVGRKALLTVIAIVNDDRKGWPATQIPPDRCSAVCAEKLQIETE